MHVQVNLQVNYIIIIIIDVSHSAAKPKPKPADGYRFIAMSLYNSSELYLDTPARDTSINF